jgi:hypothetical protein
MPDDLELSSAQRKEFFADLLTAFPNVSDLKRVVVIQMGENLDAISQGDNLQDIVLDLITWARARGKTRQLVMAAYEDNPDSPALRAFAASLGLVPGVAPAEVPAPPSVPAAQPARVGRPTSSPTPSGNQLLPDDQFRLRDLLRELPALQSNKVSDRIALLERAGLTPIGMSSDAWGDPPSAFAEQVLSAAANQQIRFETTRPGYTPLGAVLVQMLEEAGIGDEAVRFVASVIVRYNLVDLTTADLNSRIRAVFPAAAAPTSQREAEKTLRQVDYYLDSKWLRDANRAMQAVCLVEVEIEGGRKARGTGFLVGPSTIMTCTHTAYGINYGVQDLTVQPNVTFRFGYVLGSDGVTVSPGLVYHLADEDWLLASSPFKELDYVLLRVEGTPGTDQAEGGPRSWLTPQAHAFQTGEQLFIIQHPGGGPAKLAVSPNAVIGTSPKPGRVIYRAVTDYGSGGAPCFTNNWELVAMHESRLPDKASAGTGRTFLENKKEGITMSAILDDPDVRVAIGT